MGRQANGASSGASTAVDGELEAVRERIEHWRRTRKKRTAMSAELWAAAISLVEERGVHAVAQALKLSHDKLKLRSLEAELAGQHRPSPETDFVELSGAHVFGAPVPTVSEVELSNAEGARMTIRLEAGHAVDVVGLSDAFWRRVQ